MPASQVLNDQELTAAWREGLEWRYATKKYDATKKVAPEVLEQLHHAVQMAPSSYGVQPYRAVIVTDPELRKTLRQAAWNQPQVTDATEIVVFAAKDNVSEEDVDVFIRDTAGQRGMSEDSLKAYRDIIVGDVVNGPRGKWSGEWAARQCYIALGFLLNAAMVHHVDATPMEGFDPAAFTKILELDKLGYHAVVMCAVGYRAHDDWLAPLKKVRTPQERLFIRR